MAWRTWLCLPGKGDGKKVQWLLKSVASCVYWRTRPGLGENLRKAAVRLWERMWPSLRTEEDWERTGRGLVKSQKSLARIVRGWGPQCGLEDAEAYQWFIGSEWGRESSRTCSIKERYWVGETKGWCFKAYLWNKSIVNQSEMSLPMYSCCWDRENNYIYLQPCSAGLWDIRLGQAGYNALV